MTRLFAGDLSRDQAGNAAAVVGGAGIAGTIRTVGFALAG
jgi:hypothetical protein